MKRLQLPQNKLARLAINVLAVGVCLVFSAVLQFIVGELCWRLFNGCSWYQWRGNIFTSIWLISSFLVSRYIWWGRLIPRAKITRSKEENYMLLEQEYKAVRN